MLTLNQSINSQTGCSLNLSVAVDWCNWQKWSTENSTKRANQQHQNSIALLNSLEMAGAIVHIKNRQSYKLILFNNRLILAFYRKYSDVTPLYNC